MPTICTVCQIAHGDLSLSNVLVHVVEGNVTHNICDFGATACARSALCGCRVQVTTDYVRAPESCLGGPVTPASDIWAVAILALAFFAGNIPWLHARGPG